MTEAAACGRAVWTAGLLALGGGSILLAMLPRDREGGKTGLVIGVALAVFIATACQVSAACGVE